jgi:hypothetical protein
MCQPGDPGAWQGAPDPLYASAMTVEGDAGSGAAPETGTPLADWPGRPGRHDRHATGAAGRIADGIRHLEQAVAAFSAAAEPGEADIAPLAIELLARTLPLCERDEESAQVWLNGLSHPNPAVAASVRERLRRSFGSDEPSWWEEFVEAAVCHSTLPLLANEVFGALDHIYALAAVPLARGGARTRELRDVLAQAVRVPAGYVWGENLLASFRERFRDATGTDTGALPADWPEA